MLTERRVDHPRAKGYPMRLLIWHVDSFTAEPTERGRSKIATPSRAPPASPTGWWSSRRSRRPTSRSPTPSPRAPLRLSRRSLASLAPAISFCTPSPTSSSSFPPPPRPATCSTPPSACWKRTATRLARAPSAGSIALRSRQRPPALARRPRGVGDRRALADCGLRGRVRVGV